MVVHLTSCHATGGRAGTERATGTGCRTILPVTRESCCMKQEGEGAVLRTVHAMPAASGRKLKSAFLPFDSLEVEKTYVALRKTTASTPEAFLDPSPHLSCKLCIGRTSRIHTDDCPGVLGVVIFPERSNKVLLIFFSVMVRTICYCRPQLSTAAATTKVARHPRPPNQKPKEE